MKHVLLVVGALGACSKESGDLTYRKGEPVAEKAPEPKPEKKAEGLSNSEKIAVKNAGDDAKTNAMRACMKLEAIDVATNCVQGSSAKMVVFGAKGSHAAGVVQAYEDEPTFKAMLETAESKKDAAMPNLYGSTKSRTIVMWKTDAPETNSKIRAVIDGL